MPSSQSSQKKSGEQRMREKAERGQEERRTEPVRMGGGGREGVSAEASDGRGTLR